MASTIPRFHIKKKKKRVTLKRRWPLYCFRDGFSQSERAMLNLHVTQSRQTLGFRLSLVYLSLTSPGKVSYSVYLYLQHPRLQTNLIIASNLSRPEKKQLGVINSDKLAGANFNSRGARGNVYKASTPGLIACLYLAYRNNHI